MEAVLKFWEEHYVPVIGLSYIGIKILLRVLIHKLVEENSAIDNKPSFVWSGIDLCLLSISVSIATHLPESGSFNYPRTVFLYLYLISSFIISLLFYGLYMRVRQKEGAKNFLRSIKLFFLGMIPFSIGGTSFVIIFESLAEITKS